MAQPRRKDLHGSVFIVVLVAVIGAMVWFFSAHPGTNRHRHRSAQATTANTASAH